MKKKKKILKPRSPIAPPSRIHGLRKSRTRDSIKINKQIENDVGYFY